MLRRSGVGANLRLDDLPVSDVLNAQPESLRRECLVSGGDDYELLFTAADAAAVRAAAQSVGVGVTRIGVIESTPGLRWLGADGAPIELHARGFDHFQ